jgi:hypothetical protein
MNYFDYFRPFRRCFYCKGRRKLLRVVHPAYHTTYDYYHQECLDVVMQNPLSNFKFIDSAIQIMDQINKDRQDERSKEEEFHRAAQRLLQNSKKKNETNELLDQLNNVINEQPPNKDATKSKFEKIFKNG